VDGTGLYNESLYMLECVKGVATGDIIYLLSSTSVKAEKSVMEGPITNSHSPIGCGCEIKNIETSVVRRDDNESPNSFIPGHGLHAIFVEVVEKGGG